MRRMTVVSIIVFFLLAALVVAMQRQEDHRVQATIACQNELVLMDYWKSLNLVANVEARGNDLIAQVEYGRWMKLPHSLQLQIGNAVYCPVAHLGKGGMARIEDSNGSEIARVDKGNWSSKAFP